MRQVRPGSDLQWPYGGRHELRRDDEGMTSVSVVKQLSGRRKRGSALASAERGDQTYSVALVQEGRGALLVLPQVAREERRVHRSAAFDLV